MYGYLTGWVGRKSSAEPPKEAERPSRHSQPEPELKKSKRASTSSPRFTAAKSSQKVPPLASSLSKEEDEVEERELPPVSDWPQRPILLRMKPGIDQHRTDDKSPDIMLTNTPDAPFHFESELFKGTMFLRVRGIESTDPDYFEGKNRVTQVVISGEFKSEVNVADVVCGQEWDRKFVNLPWAVTNIYRLIKAIYPSLSADLYADHPSVALSLAVAAQNILVQELTDPAPDLLGEIKEDTTLFGGAFERKKLSIKERKSIFGDKKRNVDYSFKPGLRYTIECFQHRFCWHDQTFSSPLGYWSLLPYMDGQPMQVLAKTPDGRYFWSIQMWHEDLVDRHLEVEASRRLDRRNTL